MSWWYDYESWLYKNWYPFRIISPIVGYDQAKATIESNQAQIDYNEYLKAGSQRRLEDWYKNVDGKFRSIKYPEFSYPGSIYGYDTGITRANLSSYSADSSLYKHSVYGSSGLYGIGSRVSRFI